MKNINDYIVVSNETEQSANSIEEIVFAIQEKLESLPAEASNIQYDYHINIMYEKPRDVDESIETLKSVIEETKLAIKMHEDLLKRATSDLAEFEKEKEETV